MRWPLRNFYTFNHLVDSYRNTISEWAVCFRYGNFTLAQAYIFEGEQISILETWLIRKSFTFDPSTNGNFEKRYLTFRNLLGYYTEKKEDYNTTTHYIITKCEDKNVLENGVNFDYIQVLGHCNENSTQ